MLEEHSVQRRFWPRSLNELFLLASYLAISASAVLATLQYAQSRADTRVARTLEYVQRFEESERYVSAQRTVAELASAARIAIADAEGQNAFASLSQTDAADLRARLLLSKVYEATAGNSPQAPMAIRSVTGFYNGLQVCIQQNVCDPATAHSFLDDYADAFWANFYAVVQHEREHGSPHFAEEMERFMSERGSR